MSAFASAAPRATAQSADLPLTSARGDGESSESIDDSSRSSSQLPGSSGSSLSFGSSGAFDPFFAPLGSSTSSNTSSNGEALGSADEAYSGAQELSSNGLSSSRDYRGEPVSVDYGPEPLLLDTRHVEDNFYEIDVWSPANHTVVTNHLLLPEGDVPRPTLYLLSGADGGAGGRNWHSETDYEAYFAEWNVNVVTPIGGGSSMYADWYRADRDAGVQQWETYITKELPTIVDANFHGTGRDAIAGASMSGGPSLHMAGAHPDRFVTAGSISGYPASSGLVGRLIVEQVISGKDGSSANLWGTPADPAWRTNDPAFDPSLLANTPVFVGTALGIPTARDFTGNWFFFMLLEVLSQFASNYFTRAAEDAGVQVTRYQHVFGAHTYSNFEQELYYGWENVFAEALNAHQL